MTTPSAVDFRILRGALADALAALLNRLAPKPRLVPVPIPIPARRPRR